MCSRCDIQCKYDCSSYDYLFGTFLYSMLALSSICCSCCSFNMHYMHLVMIELFTIT
uniref:Uncharacterized protein n=1 Tax=Anguilla anguilla TaxID=7936 RepID=A0A0E9R8G7_ANGAN